MKKLLIGGVVSFTLVAVGCGNVKVKTEVNGFKAKDSKNAVFGFFALNNLGAFDNEDFDGDGNLDIDEDVNLNGILDGGEDIDGDGNLDSDEDANGNGVLDRTQLDLNGDGVVDGGDIVSGSALFIFTSESENLCDEIADENFVPENDASLGIVAVQFKTGAAQTDIASGNSLTQFEGEGDFDFAQVGATFSVFENSVQLFSAQTSEEVGSDTLLEIDDLGDTLSAKFTGTFIEDDLPEVPLPLDAPIEAKFKDIEQCAALEETSIFIVAIVAGFGGLEEL